MNIRLTKKMKEAGILKVSFNDNKADIFKDSEIIHIQSEIVGISDFILSVFPNCCGMCILSNIQYHIHYDERLAYIITYISRKLLKENLLDFGAPNIMCTLSDESVINSMIKCGWEVKGDFYNENSESNVSILTLKV